jgi:hypothetical protein
LPFPHPGCIPQKWGRKFSNPSMRRRQRLCFLHVFGALMRLE